MIELLDIVILKIDDPKTGIKAGTEGTIVDILGNGKAFTVEFFDEDGNTISPFTPIYFISKGTPDAACG